MTKTNCITCKYSTLSTKNIAIIRLNQNSDKLIYTYCTHKGNPAHHTTKIGPPLYRPIEISHIANGNCPSHEK